MADGGSSSGMGSGGMLSKLEAAKIANSAGVHLAIISGHKDHPLSAFAQTGQGTVFHSAGSQGRSEEHTSELQSLMRISYAVFCLKKKKNKTNTNIHNTYT